MRLRFGISGSVSGAVRLAAIALLIPAGLWLAWPGTTRAAHLTSATIAGRIFTVAGALRWTGPRDESKLATAASFSPSAVAAAPGGGFLVLDTNAEFVLHVYPDGAVSTVLSGIDQIPGAAFVPDLCAEGGITARPHGGFLIADTCTEEVLDVAPDGRVSTVAGSGQAGYGGDGGPATRAKLSNPAGLATLPDGGFLIADSDNNRVRRVWSDGHISTVAGGRRGFRGDGGPATRAALDGPEAVAPMPGGGFLIADTFNRRIRRVWPDGHISTVAGNGQNRSTGDGGPARSAAIGLVFSVAALPSGGFVTGSENNVRQVTAKGTISTIAGGSPSGLPGDGGPASEAQLYGPPNASTPSLAALPDGGILIGFGTTVRLVAGPRGTHLLGAAILPLDGIVARHVYRARVVLTHPARLTIRIYRSPTGPPLVRTRVFRPAGESTVSVAFARRVTNGLYAIDLRAQSGPRTTRAEQYVYLGGSVTEPTIRSIDGGILANEESADPNAVTSVGRCHQFGSRRVDCVVNDNGSEYVKASFLTSQGQLLSRTYNTPTRRGRQPFQPTPNWLGPALFDDLGAAWDPFHFPGS